METNTPAPTITKRIMHNGIEIRRSNEMIFHKNPMKWVIDTNSTKLAFDTLAEAKRGIDAIIQLESHNAYSDWSGNYWIVRPINGTFTEVTISRDEFIAIRKAGA